MFWNSVSTSRKFLDVVGQDLSDVKSNWLYVDIFSVFLYSFEISSKMIFDSPKVLKFNQLFFKSTDSSITNHWFSQSSVPCARQRGGFYVVHLAQGGRSQWMESSIVLASISKQCILCIPNAKFLGLKPEERGVSGFHHARALWG